MHTASLKCIQITEFAYLSLLVNFSVSIALYIYVTCLLCLL